MAAGGMAVIYLDNAATTMQKPSTVYGAVMTAMRQCASSGRSAHEAAQAAAEILYLCREAAGNMFCCRPEQVVLTHNATHGLNLAIHSLIHADDPVVISGFEHNAVVRPLTAAGAEIRVAVGQGFDRNSILDEFDRLLQKDVKAAVCTHVSNVFGWILPIEEIADLCRERNIPLIVDASQSAGLLPISLEALQASFIAMPGHKTLYGPQGTGLLLCGQPVKPLLHGGTGSESRSPYMPKELPDSGEAGTHNVPGAAGLLAGMQYIACHTPEKLLRHDQILIQMAYKAMKELACIKLYRPEQGTGVLSFSVDGWDSEDAAAFLGRCGYGLRAGLHCAPLAHKTIGTLENGTIRLSVSAFTTEGEILRFLDTISSIFP